MEFEASTSKSSNSKQQPLQSVSTNIKKRKLDQNAAQPPQPNSKQPRKTIDSFFMPQVPASSFKDKDADNKLVSLNAEQNDVLRMVVDEGKNVFFTGSAGTGKSLLLRAIIAALRKKHGNKPDVVSVTASTGMASSSIGGMTIHAWGAVAPTTQNVDTLISYIKKCKPALQRWKNTQVLVVDEVSMVDGHLFSRLAAIAAKLRKRTNRPFGGIQIVVTGDFFQLPPVSPKGSEPFFAFESEAWKNCIEHTITLKQVFRQKDNKFVDLLNEMRKGSISPIALTTFHSLSRPLPPSTISPTELFPLRHEVDHSNASRLRALPFPSHTFLSRDSGKAEPEKRKALLKSVMAPERLELKRDAQVMLVKNMDSAGGEGGSLVNGSVGRVVGFWRMREVVGAGTGNGPGEKGGLVRGVKLASDGRTPVVPTSSGDDKENAAAGEGKGKGKKREGVEEPFPLVEFITPSGKEVVLLGREEFRVEDNEGNLLARRMQVPLVLAWAMSIHKSQGQTIHRVKIDLGKVFEKGQSYVALSRAASLGGLQVLRFDPKKVMAHPKVIKWSESLECSEGS